MDRYIFDIPIYRCDRQRHYAEMDRALQLEKDNLIQISGSTKPSPYAFRYIDKRTREKCGGPWEFNQVIGWLRLFVTPSHIGGHLWFVDAKRINRDMRKKRFYLTSSSNVLATYSRTSDDSTAIFDHTLSCIISFANQGSLKKRFLDVEQFKNIGPFINWRTLLDDAV